MKLNPAWPPRQRIEVAVKLLSVVQSTIYDGTYSQPGKPNITSVIGVLVADAAELVPHHKEIEALFSDDEPTEMDA